MTTRFCLLFAVLIGSTAFLLFIIFWQRSTPSETTAAVTADPAKEVKASATTADDKTNGAAVDRSFLYTNVNGYSLEVPANLKPLECREGRAVSFYSVDTSFIGCEWRPIGDLSITGPISAEKISFYTSVYEKVEAPSKEFAGYPSTLYAPQKFGKENTQTVVVFVEDRYFIIDKGLNYNSLSLDQVAETIQFWNPN